MLFRSFNIEILKSILRNQIEKQKKQQNSVNDAIIMRDGMTKLDITNVNEQLIDKVTRIIKENITDSEFDVEMLCEKVGISRVHLYRKMKEITNQTPHEFVRNIRLKIAGELLKENKQGISYIAYAVGFSNISHFSKSFKAHYGISPKAYSEKNKQDNLIEIE